MTEKVDVLVQRLLERTRCGQLKWEARDMTDDVVVSFAASSVVISPYVDGECMLRLYDDHGRLFAEIGHDQMSAVTQSALRETYRLARRRAFDVDTKLDELLSELA
jgi:hypothetical protein